MEPFIQEMSRLFCSTAFESSADTDTPCHSEEPLKEEEEPSIQGKSLRLMHGTIYSGDKPFIFLDRLREQRNHRHAPWGTVWGLGFGVWGLGLGVWG